jgi:hypothetical protein
MDLRIFSYLPNPRIWKATIAARLCGITIDIRGAAPNAIPEWLWDFEAHPMTDDERANSAAFVRQSRTGFGGKPLYKTDAFLEAAPAHHRRRLGSRTGHRRERRGADQVSSWPPK